MDLRAKVAVVTGASRGLGYAFSKTLLHRGARVYGLARSADDLNEHREELGDAFVPVRCDVTQEDQVREAFEQVRAEAGRLDVLVNNAGLGHFAPVDELTLDDWDVQMEVNLKGMFLCTRAAVPLMRAQNEASGFGGHIVNIASIAGLLGNPNLSAYNASKFGVRGFSESIMKELRDDGIKVTCIYPGSVDTHFFKTSGSTPSPNAMRPEDIASTVAHVLEADDNYLISEVVMRPLRPKG